MMLLSIHAESRTGNFSFLGVLVGIWFAQPLNSGTFLGA